VQVHAKLFFRLRPSSKTIKSQHSSFWKQISACHQVCGGGETENLCAQQASHLEVQNFVNFITAHEIQQNYLNSIMHHHKNVSKLACWYDLHTIRCSSCGYKYNKYYSNKDINKLTIYSLECLLINCNLCWNRCFSVTCWISIKPFTISNIVSFKRAFAKPDSNSYGTRCWYFLRHKIRILEISSI
jgi:hypothetical protein